MIHALAGFLMDALVTVVVLGYRGLRDPEAPMMQPLLTALVMSLLLLLAFPRRPPDAMA